MRNREEAPASSPGRRWSNRSARESMPLRTPRSAPSILHCTQCGRPDTDGFCVDHDLGRPDARQVQQAPRVRAERRSEGAGRRGRTIASALMLAVVLLSSAAMWFFAVASLDDQRTRFNHQGDLIRALTGQVGHLEEALSDSTARGRAAEVALTRVDRRLGSLEADVASQPDPDGVAAEALRSVFTIQTDGSQGSGFAVSSDGSTTLIITNYHVIESTWAIGSRDVQVTRHGKPMAGTIVAVDAYVDLAAIRVQRSFPELTLSPDQPAVGDFVLVVGSPYGLEGTVVSGIVSAFRDSYLQLSAPVNLGNSGGPVLDGQGRVIGVIVAKSAPAESEGLSFAIPAEVACLTVIEC